MENRHLKLNRKGEITDVMIFLITIFILAIGLFFMIFIIPYISGGLATSGLNNSLEGAAAIQSLTGFTATVDNGFLMLFVGLIISVLITSFLVRTHPIFIILYILFMVLTIIISFYLGNAYYDMVQNPILSTALVNSNYINLIMSHIAEITVAVGILSIIIVFSKFSTFGGTQQY